jgi:16S rRNA (adenine1518-N6/adenine1519-N6)-dimethyltransferase
LPSSDESFFRVVRAGFGEKRKQLANTLATGLALPKEQVVSSLKAVGVEPSRRAETLSLSEWAAVERVLSAGR